MDTLRRRIPFKFQVYDDDGPEDEILDEQQQDEVIEQLRKENDIVNQRYSIGLKLIVGLSFILHVISFNNNPLFTIFPAQARASSIPMPATFTILALYIHLNLTFLFFSTDILARFRLAAPIKPHSFQQLYILSAVPPTICLLLLKAWQEILWWCTTLLVVFIVQTVMDAIEQNNHGITNMKTLKYTAPGA